MTGSRRPDRMAAGAAVVLSLACAAAGAATLPAGFSETVIATGINDGTAMAFAPDGRSFVCRQTGSVRVIKNGALVDHAIPQPFRQLGR